MEPNNSQPSNDRPVIYISYSHKDKKWRELFVKHLRGTQLNRTHEIWDDTQIQPGAQWMRETQFALSRASAALLLVTADYLASDFIQEVEGKALFERRLRDGILLFPVIVKPCNWLEVPWLSQIQVMPPGGKPLSRFRGPNVEQQVHDIVDILVKRISTPTSLPPPEVFVSFASNEEPWPDDSSFPLDITEEFSAQEIDAVLTLAYRLVLSRRAKSPAILERFDPNSFFETIKQLNGEGSLGTQIREAQGRLEQEFPSNAPDGLWLAWIKATQPKAIAVVMREMHRD